MQSSPLYYICKSYRLHSWAKDRSSCTCLLGSNPDVPRIWCWLHTHFGVSVKSQAQQSANTVGLLSVCDPWHKEALNQEKLWDSSGPGSRQIPLQKQTKQKKAPMAMGGSERKELKTWRLKAMSLAIPLLSRRTRTLWFSGIVSKWPTFPQASLAVREERENKEDKEEGEEEIVTVIGD